MPAYVIDTETGGFEAATHALVSLSIVELDEEHQVVRGLDLFITPCQDRTVTEGAAKINGYTPELWASRGAVPLAAAMQQLQEWLGTESGVAIAHNAKFDQGFVNHYAAKAGVKLPLHATWLCTLTMFRDICFRKRLSPANHKLDSLARICGHWAPEYVRGTHGAKEDTLACAAGYKWLKEQLGPKPAPAKMTFEAASAFVLTFGIHKGRKLNDIAIDDRGLTYLDWLLGEQKGPTHNPQLKAALEAYLTEPSIAADLEKLVRE